jgi:hypothetical protein
MERLASPFMGILLLNGLAAFALNVSQSMSQPMSQPALGLSDRHSTEIFH